MPDPVRIWLEISHHGAFRISGWAFVRTDAGGVSGSAGGARRIDLEGAALRALVAAVSSLPPGEAAQLLTSSPAVLAIPSRLSAAEAGTEPPTDDLVLWAQVATALRRPDLVVTQASAAPGTPSAFAAAWAELAYERAKAKGEFAASIPKANLAKAGV